jgi:hypothetical protein
MFGQKVSEPEVRVPLDQLVSSGGGSNAAKPSDIADFMQ